MKKESAPDMKTNAAVPIMMVQFRIHDNKYYTIAVKTRSGDFVWAVKKAIKHCTRLVSAGSND